MKDVWSYFSLQAQCNECKVEISILAGSFSILLTHLQLEHNIFLDDGFDKQSGERNSKEAFVEEGTLFKTENESDGELVDNFDHISEETKPIGIQILKLEKEEENETEEFLEALYGDGGEDEDLHNSYDTLENAQVKEGHSKKVILKKRSNLNFSKFDYFVESTDREHLSCKYCEETFPQNVLPKNLMRKLKKHLLAMHKEKLSSSLAELLTDQLETEVKRRREYKERMKVFREEEEEVFDKKDLFDRNCEYEAKFRSKVKEKDVFNKFDHFDESNEGRANSETICKYCGERFSNNDITERRRHDRLKRHLLLEHKDKLDPSLAEFLTIKRERGCQRRLEYMNLNKEKFKKQRMEESWSIDPETGKVVNLKTKAANQRREKNKCPYEGCTRACTNSHELKVHIRAVHTLERPFQCSDCGKRFNLNAQLVKHKRSHSDEANFPCQYCDKRYKNPNAVAKHQTKGRGCEGLKKLQALGYSLPEPRIYTKS